MNNIIDEMHNMTDSNNILQKLNRRTSELAYIPREFSTISDKISLIDIVVLRAFQEKLQDSHWVESAYEKAARVREWVELFDACTSVGLTRDETRKAFDFGNRLAQICMFGVDRNHFQVSKAVGQG